MFPAAKTTLGVIGIYTRKHYRGFTFPCILIRWQHKIGLCRKYCALLLLTSRNQPKNKIWKVAIIHRSPKTVLIWSNIRESALVTLLKQLCCFWIYTQPYSTLHVYLLC